MSVSLMIGNPATRGRLTSSNQQPRAYGVKPNVGMVELQSVRLSVPPPIVDNLRE